MKKTVTLALTLALVLGLLSGCANNDTPADNAENSKAAETAENFTDEMKIPYAVDLSPEDGADSVERSGDHENSPYFAHPDVYNMESTDTLERDKFRYYIMQDFLYLKDYAKTYAVGVAKAKSVETANLFAKYINVMNGELDVHKGYMGKFEVTQEEIDAMKPSLDNLSYTSYMVRVAYDESEVEVLAAVLSCAYSYEVIAKKIVANRPESVDDPFYGDWIRGYASDGYAAGNVMLIETLDRLSAHYTEEQLRHLEDIFIACSRYEMAFWQMAWEMRL